MRLRQTLTVLMAAGALVLGGSAAAAAPPWTISPASAGQSTPTGTLLWADGVATTTVSGRGRVVVRARADLCGSTAPEVEIRANGALLGRNLIVNGLGHPFWDYPTGPQLAEGTYRVEVRYLNDWAGHGCDRNVRLDTVVMSGSPAPITPTPPPTPTPPTPPTTPRPPVAPPAASGNPFAAQAPYADADVPSASAAAARRSWDPAGAAALDRLTRGGSAAWLGDWLGSSTRTHVRDYVNRAHAAGRTPYLVTYAIPNRDCSQHSGGGLTPETYNGWTQAVADGIRAAGGRAVVIVEPDAVPMVGQCGGQGDRLGMIRESVRQLTAAGATVYIDAGNADWSGGMLPEMASRLRAAGIDQARGFSTNVSNFIDSSRERSYAERLRAELGGVPRYVIDTSRNGAGSNGEWCNPSGRKIGTSPRVVSDGSGLDAYLWIKKAGESDGTCNGGPPAGQFWVEYAIGLAS